MVSAIAKQFIVEFPFKALLYKGPDFEQEMATASLEARKRKVRMEVRNRYELPDNLGTRTIVELTC